MTHWPEHRLGELVEILSGFAFDSENFVDSGEMPIVRIRDIVPGKSSTFYNGEYDKKYVLCNGDMLIGMDGEFNLARWQGGPALLNQRLCRIAASDGLLDDGYLFRFLPAALKAIEEVTPYVTVKHLSVKTIRDIQIPLPPLVEQRRIAQLLDQAETLRAKRRDAIAQLNSLTQAVFLEIFGDPVANPKGWKRVQLGAMVERITKGESPGWQGFEYQNSGALFVTSENVRLGAIDLSAPKFIPLEFNRKLFRSELRAGDLLVNLVGASIGRSCIFPGYECPANINQAVAVVTVIPSQLDNTFLSGLLTSERGQWLLLKNRVEGARANISLTDLRELNLPLPPIELQREFARRVGVVENLKALQRESLAQLDALFASLQHRAFRGEL